MTKTWKDSVEPAAVSARAPFIFHAQSRYLGVLKHPSFSETTVAQVFETLLRQGEERRQWPSTEWSVEPILDESDFVHWLHTVDSVQHVNLVARLPNPDGLDEFGSVWDAMDRHKARMLRQIMEAADPDVGLRNVEEDQRVREHIAMATNGFGYVSAKGVRGGRKVTYDQRHQVARESTDELGPGWLETAQDILNVVRRRYQRSTRARQAEQERR
ncbi:hypothetical protein E1295_44320 [Nonomuraea mesophila]|uniref:Uncharacterized protein n=1 Tax=Nonomuraea mesophila TaxID=2530382 RepID=A0A4R5E6I3_9ACTN|nr:hypothetical protein [Nonomuraea mesophila]TDE26422.1 hypothetical protein E1295_44320 [Nonomuraea mesophila]